MSGTEKLHLRVLSLRIKSLLIELTSCSPAVFQLTTASYSSQASVLKIFSNSPAPKSNTTPYLSLNTCYSLP